MNSLNKFSVVFDTNAYREFTYDENLNSIKNKVLNLIKDERGKGIQAFSNPFVMLELASHIADVNDNAYENCKLSVIALAQHAAIQNDGEQIAILADSESQLCKFLFNEQPLHHSNVTEILSQMYKTLSQFSSEDEIDTNIVRNRENLMRIKLFMDKAEKRFINEMMDYVVLGFNPKADNWEPLKHDESLRKRALNFLNSQNSLQLLAQSQVKKTCSILNKQIDDSELDNMTSSVLEKFEVPLQIYNEILKRIVISGCDLTKKNRSNWIWDMQIAFVIGASHRVNNCPVRLVTSDKDIINAAKNTNCSNVVYSLQRYIDSLKDNTFM